MKPKLLLLARVAVAAAVAVLLASCYAPLKGQDGHFNLGIKGLQAKGSTANVLVLVIDSSYQASLAELLSLVSKGRDNANFLSSTDKDRLKALGQEMSTNALVRFGGYPFYQTTIDTSLPNGSFDIPGVPADRSYFVKFFVLNSGVTFDVSDLDASFYSLVQSQNYVFTSVSDDWANQNDFTLWTPDPAQPVAVTSGGTTGLSVTLYSTAL